MLEIFNVHSDVDVNACHCTLLAPQVVARVLWLKQTLEEAILAKRLHHQLFPNVIKWEPGFPQVRYLTILLYRSDVADVCVCV